VKGKCLCESVTIETSEFSEFEACHCGMCRRWGSGPYLAVHCGSEITITGKDTINVFDSSEWAARAFCSNCGSHLYYYLKPANEYAVSLGLFQGKDDFQFTQQIFVDRKPEYYEFSNKTENLTEQQVFEKFGA